LFWRELIKNLKTFQGTMLFSISGRVLLGGQHSVDAALASLYVWFWGRWQYAWPWRIINRGNQVYEETTEAKSLKQMDLKVALDQALQVGTDRDQAEAFQNIVAFAREQNAELPPLFTQFETAAEALINAPPAPEKLPELQRELRENSQALLKYVLDNPLVATQTNAKVEWFTTLGGALITTYLASSLFAESFHPHSHAEWITKVLVVGAMSMAIYTGLYNGEKFVLPVVINKWRSLKDGILTDMKNSVSNWWKGEDPNPPNDKTNRPGKCSSVLSK
jgi:hypothetical protein